MMTGMTEIIPIAIAVVIMDITTIILILMAIHTDTLIPAGECHLLIHSIHTAILITDTIDLIHIMGIMIRIIHPTMVLITPVIITDTATDTIRTITITILIGHVEITVPAAFMQHGITEAT